MISSSFYIQQQGWMKTQQTETRSKFLKHELKNSSTQRRDAMVFCFEVITLAVKTIFTKEYWALTLMRDVVPKRSELAPEIVATSAVLKTMFSTITGRSINWAGNRSITALHTIKRLTKNTLFSKSSNQPRNLGASLIAKRLCDLFRENWSKWKQDRKYEKQVIPGVSLLPSLHSYIFSSSCKAKADMSWCLGLAAKKAWTMVMRRSWAKSPSSKEEWTQTRSFSFDLVAKHNLPRIKPNVNSRFQSRRKLEFERLLCWHCECFFTHFVDDTSLLWFRDKQRCKWLKRQILQSSNRSPASIAMAAVKQAALKRLKDKPSKWKRATTS